LLAKADLNLQNKEKLIIYKDFIYSDYGEKYTEHEKIFTAYIFRNKEMYDEWVTGFYKQLISIEKNVMKKIIQRAKKLKTTVQKIIRII